MFPVPARLMDHDKWQWINVGLLKAPSDSRPESYKINPDSIVIGDTVGTQDGWRTRSDLIKPLKRPSMCRIQQERVERGFPTLGVFRPYRIKRLLPNDRCLTGGLPEFGTAFGGSFRRIVQTPGGIAIFYDVGQGQGWQRNIVMNGSPHLPDSIRQWYGDSRGHWEGNTLVVDVTNFSPKTDFRGARENLHLVERWTRTAPNKLEYEVTVEDPTVWTRQWTVNEDFNRQSDEENRI
jgi:hypothetical protein